MIASHRLVLLVTSISAALLLSACQPMAESNQSTPVEESTTHTDDMSHSEHDGTDADMLTDDGNAAAESEMSDMLKDYTKSMSQMHDEMMVGMNYNDPDTAFAKGMLGHHRGAVDMAKIELKYGTDDAMRQLAQDIITAQQAEIDILNKWLASHPDAAKPKSNTEAMQLAYAKGMSDMHGEMSLGIADPTPDMAFARGMLPHHIAAVNMATTQLIYGTDEEMRVLAQNVIDTQQTEIDLMKNWIATHQTMDNAEHTVGLDSDAKNDNTKNNDAKNNEAKGNATAK